MRVSCRIAMALLVAALCAGCAASRVDREYQSSPEIIVPVTVPDSEIHTLIVPI